MADWVLKGVGTVRDIGGTFYECVMFNRFYRKGGYLTFMFGLKYDFDR